MHFLLYSPALAWSPFVASHMASPAIQASMVNFASFCGLLLLARTLFVRGLISISVEI